MSTIPSSPPARNARPLPGRPPGPDPVRLAALLARAWFEVRAGHRPLSQLAPLVSPAARRRLAAQLRSGSSGSSGPSGQLGTSGPPPRVRRAFDFVPVAGVHEVTVLIDHEGRTTAMAVRMERHRGAWRAVELTAPEAGLPPLPTASVDHDNRPRDAFDEVFEDAGESLPPHLDPHGPLSD
jgi:hypothetical protein